MHPQTRTVQMRGIPAFGLHYWSDQLAGIERVERTGRAVQYNFRYDPVDISRISLFRNGEWVGDGNARELQQADGTFCHSSLAQWKGAKRLAGSLEHQTISQTPAELALISDCHSLSQQRTQEKKAAPPNGTNHRPNILHEPKQTTEPPPHEALDPETERVLRFLHG